MRVQVRLFLALFLALAATLGQAASVRVDGASVYVNEMLVLTLKSGKNESRAAGVAASLAKLDPDSQLRTEGNSRTMRILTGDRVVLTVARLEAKAHGLTVPALAAQWVGALKKAIVLPPIAVSSDTFKVPLGKPFMFEIQGSQARKVALATNNTAVATASRTGAKVTVTPKALGEAVISLKAGDATKSISVRVLPFAASLPQSFSIAVTGDPATAETVRGAVETALWTKFKSVPGTEATFRLPAIESLALEDGKTFAIGVTVSGPDAFPVEGQVQVSVRNEPVAYKAESELWYCNDPENVTRFQNLFAAELRSNDPVRFLYHHLNAMPLSMLIDAQVINDSDRPARLLVIPGDKRDKNPVLAGLIAGDQLLRNWVKFSAEVVTLPPKSSVSIALRRLAPQDTMSGLAYLRLLPGGPSKVFVRVDSVPIGELDPKAEAALSVNAPWRRLPPSILTRTDRSGAALSTHVYPTPFKSEEVEYEVGGKYGFVRIGQKPIPRANGKGLDGNFGVFYTIDAKLSNQQDEPADVEVVFEASAGYSGALFVLNGEVLRTPLLQPKEEAQITRVKLQPGERKQITFMTVPLSGSSYPATIVVRPVGSGLGKVRRIDHSP